MLAFAKALADLHHAANNASIQEFPAEAIRLVRKWIAFDGAVLGMGRAGLEPGLEIADAYVHNREQSILDDYAQISADDPVTSSFLGGLAAPLCSDCGRLYTGEKLDALRVFSRRYDLRQLMIFGNAPSGPIPARWLVMYRGAGAPFSATDAQTLHALWLHLSIAIDTNHLRALDRIAPPGAQRAFALINARGAILAADPMFTALLRKEWPGFLDICLPHEVVDSYMHNRSYRGACIDIMFAQRFGHIACSARLASAYASLSPAENRVALLFSAGMSQKEVARALGVSEHTVRTQLKSSYSKLGVHDKAALTRYLVSHS